MNLIIIFGFGMIFHISCDHFPRVKFDVFYIFKKFMVIFKLVQNYRYRNPLDFWRFYHYTRFSSTFDLYWFGKSFGHHTPTRSRIGSLNHKWLFNLSILPSISHIHYSTTQTLCGPNYMETTYEIFLSTRFIPTLLDFIGFTITNFNGHWILNWYIS